MPDVVITAKRLTDGAAEFRTDEDWRPEESETFLDASRHVGAAAFKEALDESGAGSDI